MKFFWLLILVLLSTSCQEKQPPPLQTEESEMALSGLGTVDESMPAPPPSSILEGEVLEKIDVDSYSYLRLSTSSGEIWAAVPPTSTAIGEEIAIANPMPMDGFESPTLNRTFDRIVFGTVYQPEGADVMQELSKAHSGVSDTANIGPINVEKAAGPDGRTVEEVFSQKLELKDRKVAVRGKVVKVNTNVLERTWIHIQDGTGDSQAKTNDLTVTSQSSTSVGDTVLIEGIVRNDKDFGMGYQFPVIIEDATVIKQ